MDTALITLLSNILLTTLTGVYVVLTWRMVVAMRASRNPAVYVDFELPDHWICVSISNAGSTAAINIKFEVNDTIPWGKQGGLSDIEVLKRGIPYLAPGRTLKYRVGSLDWKSLTDNNSIAKIVVTYENEAGQKFKQEYDCDVQNYRGVLFDTFRDSNYKVADAIERADRNRQSENLTQRMFGGWRNVDKKRCPMCGEFVPQTAKKCSHCLELIEGKESPKES